MGVKKIFWLSYDLGIKGDYTGLYTFLDSVDAKECGDSVAFFTKDFGEKFLDALKKEIEKYVIYRSKKDEPLTIIKTLTHPIQNFEDKTLNIGNVYEYRIKAVYLNGVESVISDPVKVEY